MELTLEQKTRALAKLGKKPWEADFQFNEDGTVALIPTPTEDRNPFSVGARRVLHSGAAAPFAAVAGTAATKAAQPAILPVAAAASALTTPLGGAIVEGLGSLGAFTGGAIAGGAAFEKLAGPQVRKFASGSEAQQLRDETEHPIASFIGDTAGQLAGFQLNNPKALLTAAGKAARLRNLIQRDLSLTTAEKAAVRNLGVGTAASGGLEVGRQLASDQEMDPGTIVKAAAQGAILGAPRGTPATGTAGTATGLAGLGEALGGVFQRKKPPLATAAPAPASPEAPPPEAPPIMSAPDIMAPDPVSLQGENLGFVKRDLGETVMPTQMTSADPAMGPFGLPKPLMTPRQPAQYFPPGDLPGMTGIEQPLRAPSGAFMMPGRARPLALPAPTAPVAESLAGSVNTPGPRGTVPSIQREVQRPLTTADLEVLAQRLLGNQISNPNKKARRPELRPANPEDRILPIEGPRTEAETLQDWMENRRAKYQEIPKADAADAPTPEPVQVLAESVRAAADPVSTKKAAFIPHGSDVPDTMGLVGVSHKKGVLWYNPTKMTPAEASAAVSGDQIDGRVLGMSQATKPIGGTKAVVTDVGDAPAVLTEMVDSPQAAAKAAEVQASAVPGGTQRLADPADVLVGREALRRRGFDFTETDQPILTEAGGEARGVFDPVTGKIQVSKTQADETTHLHEGAHGELQSMMLSGNPRVAKLAYDMLSAANEETVVDLAARAGLQRAKTNPLVKIIKDNWDYLKTTKLGSFLGGRDQSPERLARLLAERFETQAPSKVPTRTGEEIMPDPERFYRGFQTPDELGGLRHMDKGRFWSDTYVIEMQNQKANQTGANNTYRGKIDPKNVTRIFYDTIDAHGPYLDELRRMYPQAEQVPVRLNDQQTGFVRVDAPKYSRLSVEQEHVPMSVIASVAKVSPEAGRAVQDAFALKDKIFGENFNAPIYNLGKQHSREVIDSAIWKRSRAGQLKTAPVFTPEEAVVDAVYDQVMKRTAALATKNGFPIKPIDGYVPELISTDLARDFERNPVEFLRTRMPEFHALNQRIYSASYDPVEGASYAQEYLKGVAKAPNSLGSDFGALTKYKREYHLPDTWREVDQLRNLERYGERYSRQLARRIAVDSNPQVAQMLGYTVDPALGLPSTVLDVPEAMQNARKALDGVLINEGRGTSGVGQDTKDLFTATQQLAYSSSMQTLSGLRNSLQKMPMHLIQARNQGELDSLMQSTFKTLNEFETQLQKAVSMNVVRPGRDPNAIDSSSLRVRMAHRIQEAAILLRKATGADFLETFNRVHDYTIGEGLAEVNMKLLAAKDPDALAFIKRFGAGVDSTMPYDEQIALMARNYAISMQSSYSAEGLPAPMLKGGAVGQLTRIQRFGFENMNRVRQMVIEPARQGNYQPLLTYLAGTVLTVPVLIKLTEALSGRPSNLPSQDEIEAGKKSPALENIFNVMSLAQITGAFGLAGSTAGALANNARGNPQAVLGDPIIGFGTGLITNLGAAVEAIRQGEPAIPVITEAVERALLNNMQLYRGLTVDRDEAKDVRNKRLFEYLTEQRAVTVPDMVSGALGIGGRPAAKISPTKSAAQDGDKEARAAIPTNQRRALDNYRGGFEDPKKEQAYRTFLRQTQGIEAEKEYSARRRAFKAKSRGAVE